MAITITTAASAAPGIGRTVPLFQAAVGKTVARAAFTFTGDTSYPTGGYDITGAGGPYDLFKVVRRINGWQMLAPGGTGGLTAGHNITFIWDAVNKKLIFMDNNAQVANATNVSLITSDIEAWGHI